MFQRLQKGLNLDFLDNKIAEEQEKQKQLQQQQQGQPGRVKRTPSTAGRGRGGGSSKRAGSRLRVPDGRDGSPAGKTPDPDDFVIGDDQSDTASIMSKPEGRSEDAPNVKEGDAPDDKGKGKQSQTPSQTPAADDGNGELPLEVQQKLTKLENLTTKYQGMFTSGKYSLHRDWHLLFYSQNSTCVDLLRNYRTAHKLNASIGPFEATLREHTPLTSISDPDALVEFLNQRSVQSSMVMEELKRISVEHANVLKERDELKVKLDAAEKKAKEAFDDAAGLRREREEQQNAKKASGSQQQDQPPDATSSDDFFSYDNEVSQANTNGEKQQDIEGKVEAEISQLKERTEELSTENAALRKDLETAKVDIESMQTTLRSKDDDIVQLKADLESNARDRELAQEQELEAAAHSARTESELIDLTRRIKETQQSLDDSNRELQNKAAAAEANLKKYEAEHAENLKNGSYVQREEKHTKILQDLVNTLKKDLKDAEESKRAVESNAENFKLQIKLLEGEIRASGSINDDLRAQKDKLAAREADTESLKKKLTAAEKERDDALKVAETKTGHEASIANLRSLLKRAEKDRDAAYQIIIDCGRCETPEREKRLEVAVGDGLSTAGASTPDSRSRLGSEATAASTIPTEVGSEDVAPGTPDEPETTTDAKKKKPKKKSKKNKKKAVSDETTPATETPSQTSPAITVDELLRNPEVASGALLNNKFGDNPMIPLLRNFVQTVQSRNESQDMDHASLLSHHEGVIERHEQTIADNAVILRAKNEELEALRAMMEKSPESSQISPENVKQIETLQSEIATLQSQISEKDVEIGKLQDRLRGEAHLNEQIENLKEENETFQESMLENGKAAADAKHELKELKQRHDKLQNELGTLQKESDDQRKKIKGVEEEKKALATKCSTLETEIASLKAAAVDTEQIEAMERELAVMRAVKTTSEKEFEELKAKHNANNAELAAQVSSLTEDLDAHKKKLAAAEKEVESAEQLAKTRFKDLSALKDVHSKLQPELKKLREDSAELKTTKAELEKTNASLSKLESKEKDLRSEIAEYKSQATGRDSEIRALKEKAKKSEERNTALEESYETARKDLEKAEGTRNDTIDSRDKLRTELKKVEDELKKSKSSLDDLEKQAKKFSDEAANLRDELQFKAAQQANVQSTMDSMQEQTRELATQMKEIKEQNESLKEELADAQRLLSERGREGETMRRLLADVEGRAEARVRDMREQMDIAVQERDRAEDEASTIGRRKARELEELKTRLRSAEAEVTRATEANIDAERREKDFRTRQDDAARQLEKAQKEASETSTAITQLTESLDESERRRREVEKENVEVLKTIQEKEAKLDKLQKSYKTMTEDLRVARAKQSSNSVQSSRSSRESSRVMSPGPKASNGTSVGNPDLGYLREALLAFMKLSEKKHQLQYVPVLKQLLHFDDKTEQQWMAAISSR